MEHFLATVHDLTEGSADAIARTATVCRSLVAAYDTIQGTPDGDSFRTAIATMARTCDALLIASADNACMHLLDS